MILTNKRVLVTGGTGFLGSYIVDELWERGVGDVMSINSKPYDLRKQSDVETLYQRVGPDVVIHCAAKVGGIGLNKAKPGELFYDNAIMGLLMMEGARRHGVEKFVQLGTICAYPKITPVPFKEEDIWNGYPEETNAPYGISKRMLITMGDAYRRQYGLNVINLLPVNLYGPRDHFDLETCHVIPAMIRKLFEARQHGLAKVTFWGTGNATREFLYIKDAARAVVDATRELEDSEPVNIGTGESISIKRLATMIADRVGYQGQILFDPSMPDGQPDRRLNTTRAYYKFGFNATTSLSDGLGKTIEWYVGNL